MRLALVGLAACAAGAAALVPSCARGCWHQSSQPRSGRRLVSGATGEGFDEAERVAFLEGEVGILLRENEVLRRRVANFEAAEYVEEPPLWALEDWSAISAVEDCRDLGKDRLVSALARYNAAHPSQKKKRRLDVGLEKLAAELFEVLPNLKKSAETKVADCAKRRVLVEAHESGFIVEGRVVSGSVARVSGTGVQVALATPLGPYVCLIKPSLTTGVDDAPSVAWLSETFPVGSEVFAEVADVVVNKDSSSVFLSTVALEESIGEMSLDRETVYARARDRVANQAPPTSRKQLRSSQDEAAVSAYLDRDAADALDLERVGS